MGFNIKLRIRTPKQLKWDSFNLKTLANPIERTVREYSDRSLIMAKKGKKTFKSLQLWFCDQIWIRRCKNKYNNFIF